MDCNWLISLRFQENFHETFNKDFKLCFLLKMVDLQVSLSGVLIPPHSPKIGLIKMNEEICSDKFLGTDDSPRQT